MPILDTVGVHSKSFQKFYETLANVFLRKMVPEKAI